ncbi:autotransporter domain-containing protein [Marinomonas agarivorans]|nr:autotransporter domain-containing protein [Marinomonas agarivorans]
MLTVKNPTLKLLVYSYTIGSVAFSSVSYGADIVISTNTVVPVPILTDAGDTVTVTNTGYIDLIHNANQIAIQANSSNQTIIIDGVVDVRTRSSDGIISLGSNVNIIINNLLKTGAPHDDARTIQMSGSSGTLTNSGIIQSNAGSASTASGGPAATILLDALSDNSTITNHGLIESNGLSGRAILADSNAIMLNNTGSITTSQPSHATIELQGNDSTITNSGSITALGNAFNNGIGNAGIRSAGNNFRISNSGSITTEGITSYGLHLSGDNARVSSRGQISTKGVDSHGIVSNGQNANIRNDGTIATTGIGSRAINAIDATIQNTGNVLTQNLNSSALYISSGDDIRIDNSGTISTQGNGSDAVYVVGNDITIINSGAISTHDSNSRGIYTNDANITNHNLISTASNNSHAIEMKGDDKTISNYGRIATLGNASHAISTDITNGTINNYGTISATGNNAFAVLGTDNTDTTLNLFAGSHIVGEVDLGGDNTDYDVVNVHSRGNNTAITFKNVEQINVTGNAIVNGDTVIGIDGTSEASHSLALASTTSSVHGVVNQRMLAKQVPKLRKPVQLASLKLAPSMLLLQEREPMIWWQFFNGDSSSDATADIAAYNTKHSGVVIGSEKERGPIITGLMVGIVNANTNSANLFDNSANSIYAGSYRTTKRGWVNTSISFLAGYTENSNKRTVMSNIHGTEEAKANFNSFFISPSVSANALYSLSERFNIQPSASIRYNMARLDEFSESGTTASNLTVASRTLTSLTTTLQIAGIYEFAKGYTSTFTTGVSSRDTDDEDVSISIGNNGFRYSSAGNGREENIFSGLNFKMTTDNNLTIGIGFVTGGNNDKRYTNKYLDIKYPF